MNNEPTPQLDFKDWPSDIIAFKWANTLPHEIQCKLLTSYLAHLQLVINHAVKRARLEAKR